MAGLEAVQSVLAGLRSSQSGNPLIAQAAEVIAGLLGEGGRTGRYDDDTWVWPDSMPPWLRELASAHDVQLFERGFLHGSPVYVCNGDCCCVFIIDDTTFLDRYSLVSPTGDWCPGNTCPCHKMPTGEVGTR